MFIIKDWADNHLFSLQEFETADDAWSFLYETFDAEYANYELETNRDDFFSDYVVVEKAEI